MAGADAIDATDSSTTPRNAAERLGHRHGPSSPSILRARTMIYVSFSHK